jgi:hypothetical protein
MAAQSRGSVKVRSWNSSPALGSSSSMYPSSSRQSRSTLTTQAGDFGLHLHPGRIRLRHERLTHQTIS